MNPKLEGVIFSKAGNLVYRGFYREEDSFDEREGKLYHYHCIDIEDFSYFGWHEDIEEAYRVAHEAVFESLEDFIRDGEVIYLPKGRLRKKRGSRPVEIELTPDHTDLVLDYVEKGGKVLYACDIASETYY